MRIWDKRLNLQESAWSKVWIKSGEFLTGKVEWTYHHLRMPHVLGLWDFGALRIDNQVVRQMLSLFIKTQICHEGTMTQSFTKKSISHFVKLSVFESSCLFPQK